LGEISNKQVSPLGPAFFGGDSTGSEWGPQSFPFCEDIRLAEIFEIFPYEKTMFEGAQLIAKKRR